MPILVALQTLFSLCMLIHAIQRDADRMWWLIVMVPFGEVAYFFAVVLPELYQLAYPEEHGGSRGAFPARAGQLGLVIDVVRLPAVRGREKSLKGVFLTMPLLVAMNTYWSSSKDLTGSSAVIFSPSCSGSRLTMGLPRAMRPPAGTL